MSKNIIKLVAIAGLVFTSIGVACGSEWKDLGTISGKSFLAIQASIPELSKYNLEVSNYTVSVTARDMSILVSFLDREQSPHVFGSAGPSPGFVIELTNDGSTVIRSYFMK